MIHPELVGAVRQIKEDITVTIGGPVHTQIRPSLSERVAFDPNEGLSPAFKNREGECAAAHRDEDGVCQISCERLLSAPELAALVVHTEFIEAFRYAEEHLSIRICCFI